VSRFGRLIYIVFIVPRGERLREALERSARSS
jgi:hypothetical protein